LDAIPASVACPVAPGSGATAAAAPPGGLLRGMFGAACLSGHSLVLNAISLPVMAYIIRSLGPTAYGQWATATSLVGAAAVLGNLGLRGTYVRAIARDPGSAPAATADQFGARLIMAAVAMAVAIGAAMAMAYPPTIVICTVIAGAGLLLSAPVTTFSDLFQCQEQLPTVALTNFCAGLALTAMSVFVAWAGFGAIGMSAGYLVGPAVTAAMFMIILRQRRFPVRPSRVGVRHLGRMLRESRFMALQQIVGAANASAVALLLPKLCGPVLFAYFAAGSLLATRLDVIVDALAAVFYPLLSKAYAHHRSRVFPVIARGLALALLLCAAIALATTLAAPWIAHILFPKNAAICCRVIRITMWVLPFEGTSCIAFCALNASGLEKLQAHAAFCITIIGLCVTVFLVARWGLIGACWSLVVRSAVQAAIRFFVLALWAPRRGCAP